MKKRFSEEQIIGFLREAEAGMPIKELCRKHGFSEALYSKPYRYSKRGAARKSTLPFSAMQLRQDLLNQKRISNVICCTGET